MKTQVTEQNGFPKPAGFVLIIIAICIMGLLQCIFVKDASGQCVNLESSIINPEPELADWMIDINCWLNNSMIMAIKEKDPEIKFEKWMFEFYLVDNGRDYEGKEPEIKEWMVKDEKWLFIGYEFYTREIEKEPELESWMLNSNEWIDLSLLAKKE